MLNKIENDASVTYVSIDINEYDRSRIKVYYVKGDIGFDGTLIKYHSGRAEEYEFEPSYFDDKESEDYYDNNWEKVEEEILNEFYNKLNQ